MHHESTTQTAQPTVYFAFPDLVDNGTPILDGDESRLHYKYDASQFQRN